MASASNSKTQGNTFTLAVAQGESPNPTATFTQAMAARLVTVGSGAKAHWKVRAQGVEAVHAELYWDGTVLWVRDPGSQGGVFVGLDRAADWIQLYDSSEVLFGGAIIRAKATGPDTRNPSLTNPTSTASNASYIDEEESTIVFSGGKKLMDMVAEAKAATKSAQPAQPAPAARISHPSQPSAQPAMSAQPAAPTSAHPGAAQPARPRVGTMTGARVMTPDMAPQPAPVPQPMTAPMAATAPTMMNGDETIPKPSSSEATVIRASPYAALEAAGLLNKGPNGMADTSPGAPRPASVMVSPSAIALPAINAAQLGGLAPSLATSPAMQPLGGAISTESAFGDDPFGPMDIPPPTPTAPPEKTIAGTQPRTLVLAAVTLLVAVAAAFMKPPPPPPARNAATAGQYEVLTNAAAPPPTNNILQLPIAQNPGLVGVIFLPPPPTDPQGRALVAPANPQDPIRLAAEAVAANRYAEAATRYEQLAQQHPEAPLFRHFATVLRHKLEASQCQPGAPGCPPSTPPTAPENSATPAPPVQPSQPPAQPSP
jgi:predicted component of type VI protein secretion system